MADWDAGTAEWYAERYGEYATNRLGIDAIGGIASDAAVVDIGCGAGAALRYVSARVKGPLIGIDPVPRMVEIARERLAGHPAAERIEFRVGGAEALPVDDAIADLVLAFDSFDHWTDHATGLAEVRRILRPGGRLVVVKDGGVAGDRDAFEGAAEKAGFVVGPRRRFEHDGVRFAQWICTVG